MASTPEQDEAMRLFVEGGHLAVEAGAGTGKTTTLVGMAKRTTRRGQYTAFNKAIVEDSARRFPDNVAANTAHSIAFRAVGRQFAHRLNGPRVKGYQLAQMLGMPRGPLVVRYGAQTKVLQPGYLASLAMRAVNAYCQSDDAVPGRQHVPYIDGIDAPTGNGRGTTNNAMVAATLEPIIRRAWESDLSRVDGVLPYAHGVYLKAFERGEPRVPGDFLLLDEAQDLSPVMRSIARQQAARGTQVVAVGDSCQAIYEWMGAVNALGDFRAMGSVAFLTQSFRFGPAIAEVANVVLAELDAELRITGTDTIGSTVGPVPRPAAVLCRTNATAVETVLQYQQEGVPVHLVGGSSEVVSFARAAQQLMDGDRTWHPELACFESWDEVDDYVENDPSGGELKLLVKLVNDYTPEVIIAALERMIGEDKAQVVVSTAHKSKGREWSSVKLAGDFPEPDEDKPLDAGELRLLYVAATRAKERLDVSACSALADLMDLAGV